MSKNHSGAPGGTRTRVAVDHRYAAVPGVRYPCHWTTSARFSVGSEGLEPSPGGLRVRCAAASTLIPLVVFTPTHDGRGGNRTLDLTLIRGLLSPLSYAPVGSKGLEPSPPGLKVRYAAVTPRPRIGRAYAFQPRRSLHFGFSFPLSSPGRTRTSHRRLIRSLCFLYTTGPCTKSGWQDSNLRSRAPKARGLATALHPAFQSERPDLNRRFPGPQPGAIPGFATFCFQ